jgi:hypothetical protein
MKSNLKLSTLQYRKLKYKRNESRVLVSRVLGEIKTRDYLGSNRRGLLLGHNLAKNSRPSPRAVDPEVL